MSIDPAFLGRREISTSEGMEQLGLRIGEQLVAGELLILTGPLGAGKTTFTRGLAEGLGVRGPVQSPTFVIARTHPSLVGRAPLIHVDAYRLGSADELDDLDLDLAGSVVVVEWGRDFAARLADSWWHVELERPIGGGLAPGGLSLGALSPGGLPVGGLSPGGEPLGGEGLGGERVGGEGLGGERLGGERVDGDPLGGDPLDGDSPRVVTVSRGERPRST